MSRKPSEAAEFTTEASSADTETPTVPADVEAKSVTQNSAVITWTASSDNTKVAGYNVFVDGGKKNINLVTDTQYALSGLIADTVYTVEVQAVDEAGNTSGNAKAEFKTEKDPFAPTPDIVNKNDLKINIEAAEKLLAMADKYTEESLTALKSAYGAASEVYNDKDAKQAHVDEKNTALLNAIKDLDEKKNDDEGDGGKDDGGTDDGKGDHRKDDGKDNGKDNRQKREKSDGGQNNGKTNSGDGSKTQKAC